MLRTAEGLQLTRFHMAGEEALFRFRRCLLDNQTAFLHMLSEWDDDGHGISAREFRRACRALMLHARFRVDVSREALDEIYDEVDIDGTGSIPLDELEMALRHMPRPPDRDAITGHHDRTSLMRVSEETTKEPIEDRVRAVAAAADKLPRCGLGSSQQAVTSSSRVGHASLPSSLKASPRPPPPLQRARQRSAHPPRQASHLPGLAVGGSGNINSSFYCGAGCSSACSCAASRATACSSSVASSALYNSQGARMVQRSTREQELTAALERHRLPGRSVPGVGKYDASVDTIARRAAHGRVRPSAWAHHGIAAQHLVSDHHANVIDTSRPQWIGPGKYAVRSHEMTARTERAGCAAPGFWSSVPQREPAGSRF